MDYKDKATLDEQAKKSLKKFKGEHASTQSKASVAIKLEPHIGRHIDKMNHSIYFRWFIVPPCALLSHCWAVRLSMITLPANQIFHYISS